MFLKGKCKQCGTEIKLDIGDKTKEEAIEKIKGWDTFHCPGNHMELCSPVPHFWDLEEWTLEEGHAPTEEEFEAEMRATYEEVRTTEEMAGLIEGFAAGFPLTNDGKSWSFIHSPKGKRWYVR